VQRAEVDDAVDPEVPRTGADADGDLHPSIVARPVAAGVEA
jgi:hypothetical protein